MSLQRGTLLAIGVASVTEVAQSFDRHQPSLLSFGMSCLLGVLSSHLSAKNRRCKEPLLQGTADIADREG